eukprot:Phypoly_transcript_17590.p1 GENE.Phypoly_transcript_17590~~Phypoly_transcript_17590.p1  ORF type:complete len:194 (+),score=24.58 Phypoly_transcript_17590:42-584(+)
MATSRWTNYFKLFDEFKQGTFGATDATGVISILKLARYYSDSDLAGIQKALEDLLGGLIRRGNNTDGRVTMEQWIEIGKQQMVGRPFEDAPDWWLDAVSDLFRAGDKYKRGIIGQDEFVELVTGVFPTRTISATLAKAAYQQLQAELDLPTFVERAWSWASCTSLTMEDIILTLVIKFIR